ncbi:hypothetical protein Btru_063566 [Bulinus truncatus]|nr:hypothetical protein Btru_063566 [Bulinus truncatus]
MAFGLGESLQSLHVFLDQNNFQSNKEQVEVIVEDIRSICLQDLSDIDHTCSLLFDKETGIISFLQKTLSTDELQNGKASALSLLSEILQNIGGKIVPYAVDIKDICLSVYSRDRFAKVKNAAVAVIIKILELTASTPIAQDLNIQTLIEKLFNDLAKPASKLAATVRAGIYHLLGVLAELHPDLMTDYSDRVTNIYVNALKVEMTAKSKKPEMSIVAGSLEGLTCLLLNFTQSAEEGSRYAYDIFKYVRMALDPSIDYTRYDAPKAALKLLGRHAGQFRQLLMDDYQTMYEKLQRWSSHNNREVLHLGTAALEAFTKEVSEALVEKAKQGQKEKAIFKFFLLKFNEIMNDKYASSKEISMAIKGYGLLAAPCRIFLSESDTLFMLSDVIIRCEHQFFGKMEGVDEKLMSIPSYLISLASIIRQVDSSLLFLACSCQTRFYPEEYFSLYSAEALNNIDLHIATLPSRCALSTITTQKNIDLHIATLPSRFALLLLLH